MKDDEGDEREKMRTAKYVSVRRYDKRMRPFGRTRRRWNVKIKMYLT
jgi:hypothetical protein